ncbi:MAG TPA: PqqD family protein [Candidatus Competibacter sp.]|nr:PqqD family protein [Candidatus Competibacteraceae bacterium]HUM93115.1 PqqD family protein [Candidatus Competibacter sp.]
MAKNFDKNSILAASSQQVSADLSANGSENLVILNLKDGVYYELKEVAARVWGLVQQPSSFQSVLDAILAEYEVEPARCESDLVALIEDLVSRGLVEVRPD